MNLTGAASPAERVRVLVAEVLPAADLPAPGRLIDVGSGNGSPGLVFALLRDDLDVTLIEPRKRRWAFLREAVRAAGAARPVHVLSVRHDGYDGSAAATVTIRALALPLGELAPLVAPGGRLIVLGGHPKAEPPFEPIATDAFVPPGVQAFLRPWGASVSRET